MTCRDSGGKRWGGASIQIGGVKYCNEWKMKIRLEHKKQKIDSNVLVVRSQDPTKLSPYGYRLNVAIYYDDIFYKKIGKSSKNRAIERITAVMAIVDEMYSEKDSLTTEIDVEIVAINHAEGNDWSQNQSWG